MTFGDNDERLGYLGQAIIQSPAVTADGWLRKDKRNFSTDEQIGLRTFQITDLHEFGLFPTDYKLVSSGRKSEIHKPAEIRTLMASGPFHMLPGDTVHFAIGLIFAKPAFPHDTSKRGNIEDMEELIEKTIAARNWYNFEKELPRDTSKILSEEHSFFVSPSPVTSLSLVNFFLKENSPVTVEIYTNLGERAAKIYDGEGRKGENKISMEVGALASGNYFLALTANAERKIFPLIILR